MIYRLQMPIWLARQPQFWRAPVVFQSDDWGNCSVGNRATLERLWPDAFTASASFWSRDARESSADVESLAEVLTKFSDRDGRRPCFTLNRIVGEPAWESIESTAYREYKVMPQQADAALAVARDLASTTGVFENSLHGAEHLAPGRWLRLLRQGNPTLLAFFREQVIPPPAVLARFPGLGAAYLPNDDIESKVPTLANRIDSMLAAFVGLFGKLPQGFVAPNHAWNDEVEDALSCRGIRFMQATQYRYPTWQSFEVGAWIPGFFGPSETSEVSYQIRTIDFEPAARQYSHDTTIRRARILLERGIPVVVNTHRANYTSSIDADMARNSRDALKALIKTMLEIRPDLSFVTSSQLDQILREHSVILRVPRMATAVQFCTDLLRVGLDRHRLE
jgi:hypothetical protein